MNQPVIKNDEKEVSVGEIRNALENIRASLKIQAAKYGNENAAWILKHL